MMTKLDEFDKALLDQLQTDATLSLAELSERINLSRNAIWRRLTRLESEGFIREKVARLDRDKLNLGLTVFISVRTEAHSSQWFDSFHKAVSEIPEITGMYRMTGDVDYVLHAFVPDMRSYDRLYKQLISKVALSDVSSSFVMEEIKDTTKVPLTYI
ncbi:Lrp/AsnC family transcriptional regulator [Rhodobacteraceae bacterium RKSG542]|uniref:Lrp/AsnC family transcriptional regulator n=1 Tax=Pseudovibrio flavus TaxID=2529854 RepID=UPI0012BBA2A1|nr:Lrp/AsnC family transcriptional regulator [Pseudovibrio flavus]MTI16561.1 Lrp/AsnC family transcriptional regulator [Pseudovibrio flavus]